jgi:CheY-like chemotaxis protein
MRVLVCDDDLDVGPVIVKLFEIEGWDGELVTSGEQCLETLAAEPPPDVLVLDHKMPGMLGIDVADKLRGRGFDRPILLCSAYLGPELAADLERLDLHAVSKIDLPALVRMSHVAALGEASGSPA